MAEKITNKVKAWAVEAEDDSDLRTESGILAYAERYSVRKNVSLHEALKVVREKASKTPVEAKGQATT